MSQIWHVTHLYYRNDSSLIWNSNLAGCPIFLFAKSSSPSSKDSTFWKGSLEEMIFQLPPCLCERSCLSLWSEARTFIGPHFTMWYNLGQGAWLKDQLQRRTLIYPSAPGLRYDLCLNWPHLILSASHFWEGTSAEGYLDSRCRKQ